MASPSASHPEPPSDVATPYSSTPAPVPGVNADPPDSRDAPRLRAYRQADAPSASPTAAAPTHPPSSARRHILPFTPDAADRLRQFAESIEPRLAPGADLDPIVDWASKLVGATARIAGLLHLASLDLDSPSPGDQFPLSPASPAVSPGLPLSRLRGRGAGGGGLPDVPLLAVERAILIADYLIEHARAAYAAMGLDPTVSNVPALLAWIKRTGRPTFTRRDALRASPRHLRTASDLDDALDALEHHGYIRLRPASRRPLGGRPSPTYEVHPSLIRR